MVVRDIFHHLEQHRKTTCDGGLFPLGPSEGLGVSRTYPWFSESEHNNFSTRQRRWEWTSPLFFWVQARVKWHITCPPPSHLKFRSWIQDGGRGTHVTHFVQLYPQSLYTASQVRTTCRSWDKGVLTDLCLTGVLTDLCLTRVLTDLCLILYI